MFDSLRKSAKFTAAQNKESKEDFVDSVGELVAYCEKNGGAIPKYDLSIPLDKVDKVIEDLKGYTKSLITEDKALARQIEEYLKKREIMEKRRLALEINKQRGREEVIDDTDYMEYFKQTEEQLDRDAEIQNGSESD